MVYSSFLSATPATSAAPSPAPTATTESTEKEKSENEDGKEKDVKVEPKDPEETSASVAEESEVKVKTDVDDKEIKTEANESQDPTKPDEVVPTAEKEDGNKAEKETPEVSLGWLFLFCIKIINHYLETGNCERRTGSKNGNEEGTRRRGS